MWNWLRLAFGALTLVAIGLQLNIHIRSGFSGVNFFSYFTNLSNFIASVVLILGARPAVMSREAGEPGDQVRAVSAVNMAVVGIVFSILLRDVDLGSLLPWVNVVLHYVMPCFVVLDWLVRPPKATLRVRHLVRCLIFPALYLAYVIIRGAETGWYPYPFFNPENVGGYGGVALYASGISVTFLVVAGILMRAGNWMSRRSLPNAP
ncbi:MAG: Pr6Pr family membrane protein [Gammaproteobacteria bacterium]